MKQKAPQKNKTGKNDAKGKIITVELVAFVFLAVYLAGYTFSMVKKPKVGIETVAYGQIDVPRQFDGLIIRDETVTFSNEAGTAVFSFGENEYVKKDSVVCAVRDKNGLDILEREIETINDSILSRALNNETTAQTEEINRINSRIKSDITAAVPLFMTGDGSEIYRFKSKLQKDIESRNGLLLTGSDGTLSALLDKRAAFERRVSDETGTYLASHGGVLSYAVDGLESDLTPENIANLTIDRIGAPPPIAAGGDREVEPGSPLFKIINSNEWRMCVFLDNEFVLDWNKGENKPIYFSDFGETKKIIMRVEDIMQQGDKTLVVFSSSKYLLDFIDKRNISFSFEDDTCKGLKIPNTAITDKTALLVPSEYIYEYWGSDGVYVKENNGFAFKSVNVLSHQNKTAYVLQNFDSVKLGTIVYRYEDGRGVEDSGYTISELRSTPGVYVANSGTADFRQIEIIKRNDYYSIIENSAGYGVKSFDSIVSDASSVTDNQIIR